MAAAFFLLSALNYLTILIIHIHIIQILVHASLEDIDEQIRYWNDTNDKEINENNASKTA
ncbi:hypothetical protein ACJX0J_009878, partial [Zea mays]